jgi:uncharacterized protein (DUF1330 family)
MTAPDPSTLEPVVEALARAGRLGGIHPTADQLRALLAHPGGGPVQMINLLRFRERAEYGPGHEAAGSVDSGAEAYQRYGEVAMRKVAERGGRLVLLSVPEQVVIGELPGWDREWDQIAIVEYPSRAAFLDMIADPEYQAATVHRDAGLERTVLLATRPLLDASRA